MSSTPAPAPNSSMSGAAPASAYDSTGRPGSRCSASTRTRGWPRSPGAVASRWKSATSKRGTPEAPLQTPGVELQEENRKRAMDGIRTAGGFTEPERWEFQWERRYTRDEWLDHLATTGTLTVLEPEQVATVREAVGAAVRPDQWAHVIRGHAGGPGQRVDPHHRRFQPPRTGRPPPPLYPTTAPPPSRNPMRRARCRAGGTRCGRSVCTSGAGRAASIHWRATRRCHRTVGRSRGQHATAPRHCRETATTDWAPREMRRGIQFRGRYGGAEGTEERKVRRSGRYGGAEGTEERKVRRSGRYGGAEGQALAIATRTPSPI